MRVPEISLRSTSGRMVALAALSAVRTVIYCYPMTGVPGKPLPEGWDAIPGARLEIVHGMGHDYPPQHWKRMVELVTTHAKAAVTTS